jgi:hypothetical protein
MDLLEKYSLRAFASLRLPARCQLGTAMNRQPRRLKPRQQNAPKPTCVGSPPHPEERGESPQGDLVPFVAANSFARLASDSWQLVEGRLVFFQRATRPRPPVRSVKPQGGAAAINARFVCKSITRRHDTVIAGWLWARMQATSRCAPNPSSDRAPTRSLVARPLTGFNERAGSGSAPPPPWQQRTPPSAHR